MAAPAQFRICRIYVVGEGDRLHFSYV